MMKKLTKQAITFLLILSVVLSSTGFTSNAASVPKLSKTKITLIRTQKKKLKLKGTSKSIKWSTSSKKVAVLKKSRKNTVLIKAKKAGKATIRAKAGKKIYTCKVTVKPAGLSKTKISLKKGKGTTIKAIGSKKVKWSASNKKVVVIAGSKTSPKVRVRAKKAGTAYIRARIGKKTYKCRVKVTGKAASKKKGSKKTPPKYYKKVYSTGPVYYVNFRKGDVSVRVEPYLKHKATANKYRKEFNIPESTKLYDRIKITITNNLNKNNVQIPYAVYSFGAGYDIVQYNNGTTGDKEYKNACFFWGRTQKDLDAHKNNLIGATKLNKNKSVTYELGYSNNGCMAIENNEPIRVDISNSNDNDTYKGLTFLYYPATEKTVKGYLDSYKDPFFDSKYDFHWGSNVTN